MKISFVGHKRLYKELFETDEGKKVLHDLADKFYLLNPTIRKDDKPEQYLVREGMRQVVLYIMQQVNYDIDSYLRNLEKHKTEIQHDR